MGFFRSLGRSIGHFFKHDVGGTAKDFFKNPVSTVKRGLGEVSKGLGTAGNVLGQVGNVASTILKNPLIQGGLMAVAPEVALGADALTTGLSTASNLANSGSKLTNVGGYRGNPAQVATNIIEKASNVVNSVKPQTVPQAVASTTPVSITHQGTQYTML